MDGLVITIDDKWLTFNDLGVPWFEKHPSGKRSSKSQAIELAVRDWQTRIESRAIEGAPMV